MSASGQNWLSMGTALVDAVHLIDKIAHAGGASALAAIKVATRAIKEGLAGELSPQAVLSQIETLHATIATNDAEIDAELDKRFPR